MQHLGAMCLWATAAGNKRSTGSLQQVFEALTVTSRSDMNSTRTCSSSVSSIDLLLGVQAGWCYGVLVHRACICNNDV